MRGPGGTQYGSSTGGVIATVSRDDLETEEGRRLYDIAFPTSQAEIQAAVDKATGGCLPRWLAAIGAGIATVGVLTGVVVWQLNEDDDTTEGIVQPTIDAPAESNTPTSEDDGIFAGLPDASRRDLEWFKRDAVTLSASLEYVRDGEDDFFTSFDSDVGFDDPLAELYGGLAFTTRLTDAYVQELSCGNDTGTGMTVVCLPGVTGDLEEGDYVVTIGVLDESLSARQDDVEYKYNSFLRDEGRDWRKPEDANFPLQTTINTNSFFQTVSTGRGGWSLQWAWFISTPQGSGFTEYSRAPAPEQTQWAPWVRSVIGGNTFMTVTPAGLYTGDLYYNVGTDVHPAGEEYMPDNVALDSLGEDSLSPFPRIIDLRLNSEIMPDPVAIETRAKIEAALPDYASWIREGNGPGMHTHLDQSAIDHWGDDQCRAFYTALAPDPTFELTLIELRGPLSWTWEIYGETIGTIADAYEADVSITQQGQTREATVHYAWDDIRDQIRVFSPCVPPPAAPPPP